MYGLLIFHLGVKAKMDARVSQLLYRIAAAGRPQECGANGALSRFGTLRRMHRETGAGAATR
jgi:hypothetical protein